MSANVNNDVKKRLEFRGGILMSLVPLLVFVVFCVLFFVVFKVFEMEALCMGGALALIVGSLLSKDWGEYWDSVVSGMSDNTMNTLALILLVVGIFGKLMTRGGVAQGFVWLGDMLGLSGGMFVVFTFVATCIIATATGTSIGTLFSAFPILYPSGILLGANPIFLAGAILSGAIFGDNIGPISDTTIASAASQHYINKEGSADIAGVVGSRLSYALIGGFLACIGFYIFGGGNSLDPATARTLLEANINPKGLIMLIPVVILLVVAFYKRNIFTAITWGIISGIVIGIAAGILKFSDILSVQEGALSGFAIDGIKNMLGTVGYLYMVAGIMGILRESGMLDLIVEKLLNSKLNKTVIGSELIMAFGQMICCVALGAANGPAIIMFGPIADEIGQDKKLHPYRRANMLDGFASTLPVLIPFTSSFVFIVITIIDGLMADYSFIEKINPISLSYSTLHSVFLFLVLMSSVLIGWGRKYEGKDGAPVKKLQ